MFIKEHEVVAGFCLHCGAREAAIMYSMQEDGDVLLTCLKREGPQSEPKLRTMACEDVDAISERIIELAMEREAILAAGETANEAAAWTLWVPDADDLAYLRW